MSTMIVETKRLFSKFDTGKTGMVTHEQFKECYRYGVGMIFFEQAFSGLPHTTYLKSRQYFRAEDDEIAKIIQDIDLDNNGMIDYIEFAEMMHPCQLPSFTKQCTEVGPLALATPSDEEIALMQKMSERLHTLAQEAADCGTKLLIDAEHLKYQVWNVQLCFPELCSKLILLPLPGSQRSIPSCSSCSRSSMTRARQTGPSFSTRTNVT